MASKGKEREKVALHLPQLKKKSLIGHQETHQFRSLPIAQEKKVSLGYIRLEDGARNSKGLWVCVLASCIPKVDAKAFEMKERLR